MTDADLRNQWEKTEGPRITRDEDNLLRQMARKYLGQEVREYQVREQAFKERARRQRKGFRAPEGSERRVAGTGRKFPRDRRHRPA